MVEATLAVGFDATVSMEQDPEEVTDAGTAAAAGQEGSEHPEAPLPGADNAALEKGEPQEQRTQMEEQQQAEQEADLAEVEQEECAEEPAIASEIAPEPALQNAAAGDSEQQAGSIPLALETVAREEPKDAAEEAVLDDADEDGDGAAGPENLPIPVSKPEALGPPGGAPEPSTRKPAEVAQDIKPNGGVASTHRQTPDTVRQEAADQVIGPEVAPPGYRDENASYLPSAAPAQVVDLDGLPDAHEGLIVDLSAKASDRKKDTFEMDTTGQLGVAEKHSEQEEKLPEGNAGENNGTPAADLDKAEAKQRTDLGDIRDAQGFLEGDVPAITEESPPARRVAKPRNGLFATTRADTLEPIAPSATSSASKPTGADDPQAPAASLPKKASAEPRPKEILAKDLNFTARSPSKSKTKRRPSSPMQSRRHPTRQSRSRQRLSSAVKKSRSRQRSPKRPPARKSRSRDRRMKRQRSPSRQRRRSPSPYKPSSYNHRRSPSWRRAKSCSRAASSSSSPPHRGRVREELFRRSKHDNQAKKHDSSKGASKKAHKEQHRSPPRKSTKTSTLRSPSKKARKISSHRRPSPSLSSPSSSPSRRKVAKRDKSEKAKKGVVKDKKEKVKEVKESTKGAASKDSASMLSSKQRAEAAATTAKTMAAAAAAQKSKTPSRAALDSEGVRDTARHTSAASSTLKPTAVTQKATTTIKDVSVVAKSAAIDADAAGKKRKKDKTKDKVEKEKKVKSKAKKKAATAGQRASSPKQRTAASETKPPQRVAVKASAVSSTAGEKGSARSTVPKASARGLSAPQPQLGTRAVTAVSSQASRHNQAAAKAAVEVSQQQGRPKPGSLSSTSAASNATGARQIDQKVIVLDEDEEAQVRKNIVAKSQVPLAKAKASSVTAPPSAASAAAPAGSAAADNDTLDSYSEYETEASVVEAPQGIKATSSTAAPKGSAGNVVTAAAAAATTAGATRQLATAPEAMTGSEIQALDQCKGSSGSPGERAAQAVKQALTSKLQSTQKQLLQLQLAVKQQQLEKLRTKLKATKGKKASTPPKAGGHVTARWRPPASKAVTWSAPLPVPKSAPAAG